MRGECSYRMCWTGALLGSLLAVSACDQDPPLGPGGEPTQLQLQIVYRDSPKAAAQELPLPNVVRVLVWHVSDLEPPPQAAKVTQPPAIDFDPDDWLSWAVFLERRRGFGTRPERNANLRPDRDLARGSLRVRAGEKFVFIGWFRGAELTHTGETSVVALPERVTKAVVEVTPFER